MAGMVAQQSCSSIPCDEQSIEPQHCIASSGVVVPPQSLAYAATANPSTARKSGLAKRIIP
jgi:hypothetical protein